MKKIDYRLEKITDQIYHLIIPDHYDMCMTFCRVQEFYESPFKEIRGKSFSLLDLMEIYSRKLGEGCFTYPIDWGGFNVPSHVIEDCYNNKVVSDFNKYDVIITRIHHDISKENKKYYLIGTTGNNSDTLKHEIIHGHYYLNEKYRKEVISIIKEISDKSYNNMKMCLLNMGYTTKVVDDEINAYLASGTGALWEVIKITKKLQGTAKKLQLLFEQYEKYNNKGT